MSMRSRQLGGEDFSRSILEQVLNHLLVLGRVIGACGIEKNPRVGQQIKCLKQKTTLDS